MTSHSLQQAIYQDFTGANYRDLAQKYDLSVAAIYGLLRDFNHDHGNARTIAALTTVLADPANVQSLTVHQLDTLIQRTRELGMTDVVRQLQAASLVARQSCAALTDHPDTSQRSSSVAAAPALRGAVLGLVLAIQVARSWFSLLLKHL